jgi:hypothetical protein
MEWVVVAVVVLAVALFVVIVRRNRELARQHRAAELEDGRGDVVGGTGTFDGIEV